MENVSDSLSISSSTPIDVIGARGLTLISPPAVSGKAGSLPVQTFRVDDSTRLGMLQWTFPLPEVNVQVESQMTTHPDSAEWVAVIRYEVLGGALDSIHLKLLTPLAASVSV